MVQLFSSIFFLTIKINYKVVSLRSSGQSLKRWSDIQKCFLSEILFSEKLQYAQITGGFKYEDIQIHVFPKTFKIPM